MFSHKETFSRFQGEWEVAHQRLLGVKKLQTVPDRGVVRSRDPL